jgi:1,4-dihydroxy-2-naphthoate octaprenyltransferase
MSGIGPWLGVARAPFLILPVALVVNGAAAGSWERPFSFLRSALALVGLLAMHIAANVLNELSDHRTGIDRHTRRTPFSGGSGTLQAGAVTPRGALVFAIVCFLVGAAIGFYLASVVGWLLVALGAVGAFTVVTYTDLLARLGLGEFAAGLGLGAIPVLGTAFVQGGRIDPAALAAAVPPLFMTFNLLLLNEFPDEQADRVGGRRHLVIALGRPAAARVWAVAALLTPASITLSVALRVLPWTALAAVFPTLLLAKGLGWAFHDSNAPVPLPAMAGNVIWNIATNVCLGLGIAAGHLL